MSTNKKIAEFPDVHAKLQKPTKQSAFERQKAEAEAKRLREAAETAAVYEDFVKSFDADDGDNDNTNDSSAQPFRGLPPPGGFAPRGGRRHFGGPGSGLGGMKSSGPGTLGQGPAAPGSYAKKRNFDGGFTTGGGRRDHSTGRLGFDNDDDDDNGGALLHKPLAKAFDASDDEEERLGGGGSRSEDRAVAKPTLRLVNLPPATSPAVIKALISSTLRVEGVRILPPTAQGTDRKSLAAIVTLAQDTAASEIDTVVSALQHRYLGVGYYLSLHRHLSSAAVAMAAEASLLGPAAGSHPFGARPVPTLGPGNGHGGGPHGGPGRFAPPSSYGPAGAPLSRNLFHVPIQPPRDIKQLRMIHKVVESVLEHGPEFEALLMSRADVQREEKWAWLWDARSQGGIWYRWRLWEVLTGGGNGKGGYLPLFEGSHAWKVPDKPLPYEHTTGVDGFISESDYVSEFDDEDDEEPKIITEGSKADEEVFLNPIEKAKLVHLLSRLPTTLSKIRKGDIARITAFAITHSNRGADEIVDLIVSNIENPLAFSSANPDHQRDAPNQSGDSRDASPLITELAKPPTSDPSTSQDANGAKLVALYVISDILSSSSTSGIRHAWRYRQLLEASLKSRRVFEGLGLMPEKLNWGRLRAEKWKRSVGLVLSLWDGWSVFPMDSQELFVKSFENPPSLGGAKRDGDKGGLVGDEERAKGRWKTVEAMPEAAAAAEGGRDDGDDSDGSYDEYTDDEELDNELFAQHHIDGESLLDIDIVGLAIEEEAGGDDLAMGNIATAPNPKNAVTAAERLSSPEASPPKRKDRMTAADMFADWDSGDEK